MRLRALALLTLAVLVALPALAIQRVVLYEQFTNTG